jgi:hypothetical protein
MKKLFNLHFKLLPIAAHFDYFKKLSDILTAAGAALKTALAALMPGFNAWLAKEDALMQWVRKSALTEQIAEADREMDHLITGINAFVQAALYSPSQEAIAIATRIEILMRSYAEASRSSYDEEAGAVRALLEQFDGPYADDVLDLGIKVWVEGLHAAFTKFETLLTQREAEQGEKPPYTAKEVRKGIEEVYHQMVYVIDANAALGADPGFDSVIDKLNPDIDHMNEQFHRARKDLGAGEHTVVEPIETQTYTEKPITVVPKVYYRDVTPVTATADATAGALHAATPKTHQLSLGKDFSVTYKNNINVGTAELTIHGKGAYKGQKTVTFNIARI